MRKPTNFMLVGMLIVFGFAWPYDTPVEDDLYAFYIDDFYHCAKEHADSDSREQVEAIRVVTDVEFMVEGEELPEVLFSTDEQKRGVEACLLERVDMSHEYVVDIIKEPEGMALILALYSVSFHGP